MWVMILGQSLFQLAITLVLTFAGSRIFKDWDQLYLNTVVFNTYVWMQVFNQVNCRGLDRDLNVFSGLHQNLLFLLITAITVGGQIIIIFFGGAAFSVVRLDGPQWALSIVLGLLSIPFGVIVRLLLRVPCGWIVPRKVFHTRQITDWRLNRTTQTDEQWNSARNDVRENLILLKRIRSGRRLSRVESAHRKIQDVFSRRSSKAKVGDSLSPFEQAHQMESNTQVAPAFLG